jgi:peptide/nickel transport system permease protein
MSFLHRLPWQLLLGIFLLALILVLILAAPWISPRDPTEQNPQIRLQSPNQQYWFGTDPFGRDVLSRVLYGGRISLITSSLSLTLVVVIGLSIGLVAGYVGGLVDTVVMRIVDALFAFPSIVLALVVAGLFGPGLTNVLIAIVSIWWVTIARVTRGMVLRVKQEPYVEAAHAIGLSSFRIIWRYILPNVLGPVFPQVTLELGNLILVISSLSFLGLGAQPPSPEWGAMLADGRSYFTVAPHLMIFPGFMIFLTVLALNLIGEALHDLLDSTSASFLQ